LDVLPLPEPPVLDVPPLPEPPALDTPPLPEPPPPPEPLGLFVHAAATKASNAGNCVSAPERHLRTDV
jgi:hypothetical protein